MRPRCRHAALLGLVTLALAAAGCGSGSSGPSVASIATTTSGSPAAAGPAASAGPAGSTGSAANGAQGNAQTEQEAVAFAGCMRSHGAAEFPDPASDPRGFKESLNPSKVHAPAFRAAERACRHLLPDGGSGRGARPARSQAQIAAMLAFAHCIRSHGVPGFPDPSSSGELSHEMLASAGIDLHQPAVLVAADACVAVTHGFITKAVVARFVAGH